MSLNWLEMFSDLTMEEYLTTEGLQPTEQTLWQANQSLLQEGSTPATGGASLFDSQGARPKSSSRLKVTDVANQIQAIQKDLAQKIQVLEQRLNEQTPSAPPPLPPVTSIQTVIDTPITNTSSVPATPAATGTLIVSAAPVQTSSVATGTSNIMTVPYPSHPVLPQEKPVSYADLRHMPALVSRVQSEMAELPIVGEAAVRDRDTFYKQLVQDTVKEAAGKLKIKSGLELESQELVRRVIYWPHAFTSEISHCLKTRKSNNINIEGFMFGALNILLLDDQDVSAQEKTHRLLLLKHLMRVTLLKGWPVARQLHNCVLQAIETKSISWDKAFDHLAQLSHTAVTENTEKEAISSRTDNSDKVLNIICKSYNSDNTEGAECAFSRDGKSCSKLHICSLCAKKGMNFKHTEKRCRRK